MLSNTPGTLATVQNARQSVINCESIMPLDGEQHPCFLIQGDGYNDPLPPGEDEAHVWVPRDSAPALFVQALDTARESLCDRTSKWGSRLRDIPDDEEEPSSVLEPSPAGMDEAWSRSQTIDKKVEDLEANTLLPMTKKNAQEDEGDPEEYDEEEEEEDLSDDEEEDYGFVAPRRMVGQKWVIMTFTEYQFYKCFMTMGMTQNIFFASVDQYLKEKRTGLTEMAQFEDWVTKNMGDRPNGFRSPQQPLYLDQIERLARVFRNTQSGSTSIYNAMSAVCASANRICEEGGIGADATLHRENVEISYPKLKRLLDQCDRLRELQKDLVRGDQGD